VKITRIIVTGGLGFIGSNFIRYLLKVNNEAEITNVDAMSYGSNPSSLADLLPDKRYKFVEGDISNIEVVKPLVADTDFVVNFAAETHVDRSISSGSPFIKSNVLGVYALLEALRHGRGRTRCVQIGTDEEYGEITEGSFTEEGRLTPSSPYAATKASASMLVLAYARTYGLDACITRCTNNFGPYQFPEKLIPKTLIRGMLGLKVPIYGTGKNVRDWIYVEDHCEAIAKVLRDGSAGEVYNISSGDELENLIVVSAVLELIGKPSLIEHVEDRPGHDLRYSLDSSKIRDKLGWKPRHTFRESLAKTVEWYLKNESWWRPLADERVLHPTPWKLKW
jgi:dTDP-glucose 4,6-dehydratase